MIYGRLEPWLKPGIKALLWRATFCDEFVFIWHFERVFDATDVTDDRSDSSWPVALAVVIDLIDVVGLGG